jgi:hypothetical protein
MKKVLQNIITLVLLVFYLTGFCGVHFIKHSCYSCDHSQIHFTVDADCSDDSDCSCCCKEHSHDHSDDKSEFNSKLCCDYSLVYLKTDPNTTLSEKSKAPTACETLLFVTNTLSTLSDCLTTTHKPGYVDDDSDDYLDVDREKLCCYLC